MLYEFVLWRPNNGAIYHFAHGISIQIAFSAVIAKSGITTERPLHLVRLHQLKENDYDNSHLRKV